MLGYHGDNPTCWVILGYTWVILGLYLGYNCDNPVLGYTWVITGYNPILGYTWVITAITQLVGLYLGYTGLLGYNTGLYWVIGL